MSREEEVVPGSRSGKKRKTAHQVKLTYLDIKGLGEPIRLALWIGNVDFEDERITKAEIGARRTAGVLPHGQVPVLEIDGVIHSQAMALLRWAGCEAGLPSTSLSIDAGLEAMTDIIFCFRPLWYGAALGKSPVTGEPLVALNDVQKAEVAAKLNSEVLPVRLRRLEAALGDAEYFGGGVLSTADLRWYVIGEGLLDGSYCKGVSPAVLASCPNLKALVERVGAHPRVVEWNARHK